MTEVLRAEGIVCGYGEADIVKGASVSVRENEVVCIIGPNGAGKSTLMKCIFGLVKARAGTVTLEGKDLTTKPPNAIVAAGLAFVPQVGNVFATMSVDENLEMGAFLREKGISEAKERVFGLFPELRERRAQRVGTMSGGQRQMVAIGRALMLDPRVLLLDEPSAGLAPMLQDQVFAQVRKIAAAGTPVLLVEQNAKKGLANSDRGIVLDQGKNAFEGKGSELLESPEVARLYLGGGTRSESRRDDAMTR